MAATLTAPERPEMYEHLNIPPLRALENKILLNLGKINIVAGKNNSGKSTLLASLAQKDQVLDFGITLTKNFLDLVQSVLSSAFEGRQGGLLANFNRITVDQLQHVWEGKSVWWCKDDAQNFAVAVNPGFPICLPQMAPLYTREPPSARNSVRRTIVQLQRPSPQPTLTWNRPEPLLSGHFSDTAPHLCPFFASLRCTRPRVSLPAPAAPRSSAASRRRAAGSDDLPPAGASSIWRASPAGLRFSPAAAGDSSATSA